jgi:hypothetical protein
MASAGGLAANDEGRVQRVDEPNVQAIGGLHPAVEGLAPIRGDAIAAGSSAPVLEARDQLDARSSW